MFVLDRWKNEEDSIKKCRRYSGHNVIHKFLRCSRGANSKIADGILTKFKLVQALIVVLIVCKNEEVPFKIESIEWSQHFSHYKSIGFFSNAQGQVTHKSLVGSC